MLNIPEFLSSIGIIPTKQDVDKKNGLPRYWACCPLHKENTPSFIYTDEDWHCFGGCKGGKYVDLYASFYNITIDEAKKTLKIKDKKPPGKPSDKQLNRPFDLDVVLESFPLAHEKLFGKYISEELIALYNVRWVENLTYNSNLTQLDYTIKNRIVFPVAAKWGVLGLSARVSFNDVLASSKYKFLPFEQQKNSCFFGIQQIIPNQTLYIVEGVMDVLALRSRDKNSIALLGCTISTQQLSLLYFLLHINKIPNVVFLLDGDDAGVEAAEQIKKILNSKSFMLEYDVLTCPNGTDPYLVYMESFR